MRLTLLLAALAVLGCRAPSPLDKQPPFDFSAHPGPPASAFSQEAALESAWSAPGGALRAFWEAGQPGTLQGVDGVEVAYRVLPAASPKGAVVLLPGRTEAIVKYAEVAFDLVGQGYSVYALTLRGQGEAGRILADPEKGYVAWFEDYVADTHRFLTEVVKPAHARVFLLAHSLGGGVATLLVDEHPEDLAALALSAPMLDINLGSFPPPLAASLGEGVCGAGDGTGYAVGMGPYKRETDFEANTVTHSQARWAWKLGQLDDNSAIRLGGTTWRWLCQSLAASSRAQAVGRFSEVPTLLLQAGEDSVVKPAGQARYCADAPRCTLAVVEGARHEVLQETDAIRSGALARVVAFFDAQVTP